MLSVRPSNPARLLLALNYHQVCFRFLSRIFIFAVLETGCHDEFVVLLRLRLRFVSGERENISISEPLVCFDAAGLQGSSSITLLC